MTETTTDEVKQTLAEYERLALSTGAKVQIDPPEFAGAPGEWSAFWVEDHPPAVARVTVHRDGISTTVYVAWDEALPAEESWRQLWQRKPMTLFGAFTIRAALRRAFRDVIGDRHEPDDLPDSPPAAEAQGAPVNWGERIVEAATLAEVAELHKAMKSARAVTPELEVALRGKMRSFAPTYAEAAKMPDRQPASRPRPAPPAVRPEETVRPVKRAARKGSK